MIRLDPGAGQPTRRLNGFGDFEVGGSYELGALWGPGGYRPSLRLRGGLGLPTGREGTFGDEDDGVPPSVLSLGLATYSAVGEVTLTQFVHPRLAFALPMSVRVPLSRTESGKSFGPVFRYGASLILLPTSGLVLSAGIEHQVRGHTEEAMEGRLLNSGSIVTRAVVNASFMLSKRAALLAGGGLPIRNDVQGQQITESFSVLGGLSLTFGAGGEEDDEHGHGDDHEHGGDHEHGDDHGGDADDHGGDADDHGKADVADAARGGQSFALADAVVHGKVTVIDFWATWCHPCKHIDQLLRRLAARHDNLAVRRVEIVDGDSPAAREHLGGSVALPVIWIYDARGRRVHTLRATTDTDVRNALEPLLR